MKDKLIALFSDKKSSRKAFILSIVAIVEIIAIMAVVTYAWVETVSSIKITDNGIEHKIDTYTYTEADVGSSQGDIDLAGYFKKAGDVHFSPASSSNGRDLFFPIPNKNGTVSKTGTVSQNYRKSTVDDKNVNYLSVTFKVKTTSKKNLDFFFVQAPTISGVDANTVRFSITAQTEGESTSSTKIYAMSASNNQVVNSSTGNTGTVAVEAISNHLPSSGSTASLFSLKTEETKIITVNAWVQGTNNSTAIASNINISNFQITTSNTPRRVTLIPTNLWNVSNPSFYAYMWTGSQNEWYDMTDNGDGSYSFNYDGTYQTLTFVRTQNGAGHTFDKNNGYWNQTVDLTIPLSPVNPTFFVTGQSTTVMDGSNNGKYTGVWQDPATIKFNYVKDDSSSVTDMGTVTLSWSGASITATGGDEDAQIRVRGGQYVSFSASAKSGYEFVGWYDNPEGTGTAISTSATMTQVAPTSGNMASYYAKFIKVYAVTLKMLIDGTNASGAGTMKMTVNGTDYTSTSATFTKNFPEGTVVSFSATVNSGYTKDGIYTTQTGTTSVSSVTVGTSNVENYVRYTVNEYDVKANAYYSTNSGSSYTAGDAGGTVMAGSATAGATSTASVKYKSTVNLVATPASGYEFVGWYSAASGGTELSTNTSYTYTLNTVPNTQDNTVNVYARFKLIPWQLKGSFDNWVGTTMVKESTNVYSVTVDLSEGDNSYKIYNVIEGKWYGAASVEYKYGFGTDGKNSTFSALSDYSMSTSPGNDAHFVTHAGKYKFSFNTSNQKVSISLVSYNNVTITLEYSSSVNLGADGAVLKVACESTQTMTKNSNYKATVSIPSNYGNGSNVWFNRKNPNNANESWGDWNAGKRGYSTTYKVTGWNQTDGSWQ